MKPIIISFFTALLCFLPVQQASATSFELFPEPWSGDTSLFIYHPENNLLQLDAPEVSGEAYLWHSSSAFENAVWETGFLMDFNPSSSNYLQIYLATDDTESFQNGFYLIAGTSDDNISLWERKNGEDALLIEGTEDRLDTSPAEARVRVTRRKGGHWKLETDTGSGWQTEGTTTYTRGFPHVYSGFSCHYTKTRCDRFFLEPIEISGEAYKDTIPPHIESMQVKNGYTLELTFSESIDETISSALLIIPGTGKNLIQHTEFDATFSNAIIHLKNKLPDAQNGDLIFSGWCDKDGACLKDTTLNYSYLSPTVMEVNALNYTTIEIRFNQQMPEEIMVPEYFLIDYLDESVVETESVSNKKYLLHLNQKIPDATETSLIIKDLILPTGDTIPPGPYSIYYHEAGFSDLVITEIMHDPSPAALLPETEYLELFNRSDLPVNLNKMTVQINGSSFELPEYILFPGNYVVLTADETDFPDAVFPDQWKTLTNSGGEIILLNPSGQVTAALRYPGLLPDTQFKQDGGWSLECIDVNNLSGNLSNWAYCNNDRGGTPGAENAITSSNPDISGPGLVDTWLKNDSVLMINFGEPLAASTIKKNDFKFSPMDINIKELSLDSLFGDVLRIKFQQELIPNEVVTLSMPSGLSDLAGNAYTGSTTLVFGLPGQTDSMDVIINELLFEPPVDGCDYVELYNRSDKIVALDSLCLARGGDDGIPESLVPLSDKCRWFLPRTYLCLANDASWVKEYYDQSDASNIISLPGLPNFVNEGGTVLITRKNGTILERMDYSPSLHFSMLSDTKGVALERTRFDAPSGNPITWHSAASTSGYGTPGSPNSQQINDENGKPEKIFSVSPEIFTPDLDGNDDQLIISYHFDSPGQKGTFIVYDAEGFQVKELINNQSLGTSGIITWDGTNDDHATAPPGIYIIHARVFGPAGDVRNSKETCVLGIRKH
jgi:hypothetical protein